VLTDDEQKQNAERQKLTGEEADMMTLPWPPGSTLWPNHR